MTNNLLFIVLVIAILYYFYYQQKKLSPIPITKPLTSEIGVQTIPDPELAEWKNKYQKLEQAQLNFLKIVGYPSFPELEKGVKKLKKENQQLKTKPITYSRTTQTDTDKDLENTLDDLLKGIQNLNKQL